MDSVVVDRLLDEDESDENSKETEDGVDINTGEFCGLWNACSTRRVLETGVSGGGGRKRDESSVSLSSAQIIVVSWPKRDFSKYPRT